MKEIFGILIFLILVFLLCRKGWKTKTTTTEQAVNYTAMRCPTCGDRARVYGDTWECEFCGDCGRISYK